MNRARNLAAVLLFITGGLHVASLLGNPPLDETILDAVFGIAYLALGYYLLKANPLAVYLTAVVTVIELVLSTILLAQSFSLLIALHLAIAAAALTCALIVIARMRRRYPAV